MSETVWQLNFLHTSGLSAATDPPARHFVPRMTC